MEINNYKETYISILHPNPRVQLELSQKIYSLFNKNNIKYGTNEEILIRWVDWHNYCALFIKEFDKLMNCEICEYFYENDTKNYLLDFRYWRMKLEQPCVISWWMVNVLSELIYIDDNEYYYIGLNVDTTYPFSIYKAILNKLSSHTQLFNIPSKEFLNFFNEIPDLHSILYRRFIDSGLNCFKPLNNIIENYLK